MINKQKKSSTYPITTYPIAVQAADLLLKCAGYIDDRNDASNIGENHFDIYYAIDPDIICLYLEPEDKDNQKYITMLGESEKSDTTQGNKVPSP